MASRSPTDPSCAADRNSVLVTGLRETYHELGEYEFKVVLDPERFDNSHHCGVEMLDSDGKPMRCSVRHWGRKMICSFAIDRDVTDGVSTILVRLRDDEASSSITVRYSMWVIKP